MSKDFNKIKAWYDDGFWNKEMVRNAVIKSKITPGEYSEITGEAYE